MVALATFFLERFSYFSATLAEPRGPRGGIDSYTIAAERKMRNYLVRRIGLFIKTTARIYDAYFSGPDSFSQHMAVSIWQTVHSVRPCTHELN